MSIDRNLRRSSTRFKKLSEAEKRIKIFEHPEVRKKIISPLPHLIDPSSDLAFPHQEISMGWAESSWKNRRQCHISFRTRYYQSLYRRFASGLCDVIDAVDKNARVLRGNCSDVTSAFFTLHWSTGVWCRGVFIRFTRGCDSSWSRFCFWSLYVILLEWTRK